MRDIIDALMFSNRDDLAKVMRHYRKKDPAAARRVLKIVLAARAKFYGETVPKLLSSGDVGCPGVASWISAEVAPKTHQQEPE